MNDNDDIKISDSAPCEVMPGASIELHPDFGDTESMWNMRKWLQKALETNGARQIGAGMGMGEADIDFELEGFKFNVRIKPL